MLVEHNLGRALQCRHRVPDDDIDEATAERYGSVPHSYVVCARDNAIRPELQRLFVKETDAVSAQPTTVVEFDASHSPFLSQPAALADVIRAAHTAAHRPVRSPEEV